jgi:hypothetical protein
MSCTFGDYTFLVLIPVPPRSLGLGKPKEGHTWSWRKKKKLDEVGSAFDPERVSQELEVL